MDAGKILGDNGGMTGRMPDITRVSILFSITIILFVMIGYRVQSNEFYSGVMITEFLLIMLPALLFLVLWRYDFRKVLRLNKTGPLNFLLIFVIMIVAIPVSGIFNLLNLLIVNSIFGKIIIEQPPIGNTPVGLFISVLVIGGTAGLCEEFLFRGVIQRGFESFGNTRAILLAAFLFSLTHLDFQKIFGTFLLGALIGFFVYRTDSLYSGMFAHFANNSAVVVITYVSTKLMAMLGGGSPAMPAQPDLNGFFTLFRNIPKEQLVIVVFFYGILLLFIISILASLIFAFVKLNPARRTGGKLHPGVRMPAGLLWLLPGLTFIAVIYYAEVMKFRGIGGVFVDQLKRLLGA